MRGMIMSCGTACSTQQCTWDPRAPTTTSTSGSSTAPAIMADRHRGDHNALGVGACSAAHQLHGSSKQYHRTRTLAAVPPIPLRDHSRGSCPACSGGPQAGRLGACLQKRGGKKRGRKTWAADRVTTAPHAAAPLPGPFPSLGCSKAQQASPEPPKLRPGVIPIKSRHARQASRCASGVQADTALHSRPAPHVTLSEYVSAAYLQTGRETHTQGQRTQLRSQQAAGLHSSDARQL